MKKVIVFSFCLLLTLGLSSCKAKTVVEAGEETSVPAEDPAMNTATVQHINTEQFLKQVFNYRENPGEFKYEGSIPCIVDFYANWCRPCKMLSPTMDELAQQYAGKIVIYKVDVDAEKELSAAFGIQSIPSLLFIPMEGTPAMQAGLMSKAQLENAIDSFLLGLKK